MSSESVDRELTLAERVCAPFAKALGMAICEPKLRLGRRRHDNVCDDCDEPIDGYALDRLEFPLDDFSPEALGELSWREKLGALLGAEYVRVCLECGHDREQSEEVIDA